MKTTSHIRINPLMLCLVVSMLGAGFCAESFGRVGRVPVLLSGETARFNVSPQYDHLWGHNWPLNDTVTIKHGDPVEEIGTAEVNEWGDFWFDSPVNIRPGDLLQVACGAIVKTHIVTGLAITAVDSDHDTVSGTAATGTWVYVGVHDVDVHRYVEVDEHGNWVADFSEAVGPYPGDDEYNLTAGDDGYAHQVDDDWDATFINWHVPQPRFKVMPRDDHLWGDDWPAHVTVIIAYGDPAEEIGTTDTDEWGQFSFNSPVDIQPGDLLRVEYGGIVKAHVVMDLVITAVDAENNTVSGTAAPETWVHVGVHHSHVRRDVEVDSDGYWVADFSASVGEEPWDDAYDLTAGSEVFVEQRDEDWDATSFHWRPPHFKVLPQNDHLWGHDWPLNDTVTIKLGDPAEVIGTAEVNEWGDFWFDSPVDIRPGDLLQVECGGIVKAHVVMDLVITDVDPENDTVSGTAAPETWVDVGVHDTDVRRHIEVDEHGHWIADFSETVGPDPWDHAYDITAGSGGYAEQRDEEGDATSANWFIADPILRIELQHNNVRGQGWPPHAAVEVTIGDPADPDYFDTVHANHHGDWWLHIDDYDHRLQAGDVVTADDGTLSRTMIIPVFEITDVDSDNDLVAGIAPEGSEVEVRIGEVALYVTANQYDEWKVDFSEHVNIEEGTEGWLFLRDENGNVIETQWRYATLHVMDIRMIKASSEEWDWHAFFLEMKVDGLLSARFQAPSEVWYDLIHQGGEDWFFEKHHPSVEAIDDEFEAGEYLLELTHYHGDTTVILEFSENVERPNATPVVIAPQERRSDVNPLDVLFEWEDVDNPNFQFIIVSVEDEFSYDEDDRYEEFFLTIENGMPTRYTVPELKPNRLYLGDVIFFNLEESTTGGDIEVNYEVIDATLGGTEFSTNTDEELFDPIELVLMDRGQWGEGGYTFEFEIELSESLQIPGESPLFHRLKLWTPEDEYYTLFDATQQSAFGDFVGFKIEEDNLDKLPGSGWYALVVQKDHESAVATWFLFADPDSEAPLRMPEQMPAITQPQPDSVVANPVTFSWEPVTDDVVNTIGVIHAPEKLILLDAGTEEYSPPEALPVGPQHALVVFGERYADLLNADSIPYEISQYIPTSVDFTVGYSLTYEAGVGGWLDGSVEQVVAPGGSGEPVAALAEDGALFLEWDDGDEHAERIDENVQADGTFTAFFQSAGGVPIDWYADHGIDREGEEDWSEVDQRYAAAKRMTLLQQYIADLNPTEPTSIFQILAVEPGPPLTVHFEPSSPDRLYTLQFTDDLIDHDWTALPDTHPQLGQGGEDAISDTNAVPRRFYRVLVELPWSN